MNVMLTYLDEEMFRTTNFFHKKMGDEVINKPMEFISDANGWLQITNVKGYIIEIRKLSKEGYQAETPYGGEMYEPDGSITFIGNDVQVTNLSNPQNGYVLHLQKIEGK